MKSAAAAAAKGQTWLEAPLAAKAALQANLGCMEDLHLYWAAYSRCTAGM